MCSMQNKERMQGLGERPKQESGQEPEGSLEERFGPEAEGSPEKRFKPEPEKSSVYVSFRRCEKKQESDTGRELLFSVIKKVYNVDLEVEKEPIQREAGGKPYLANHLDICFNISHSEGAVICVVGSIPMGIDLQIHRKRNIEKTAKRILSQEEWNWFEKSGHAVECFYEYWTKKESYLKYTGEGIRRELRELEYTDCRFYRIPFDSGYSCTLCIDGQWAGEIVAVETEVVR